jgi:vitamin B12 transporter
MILLFTGFARATAQRVSVSGHVDDARARAPVAAANVFILGGLDGALTDSTGRFSFSTTRRPPYILVVKRIGYRDAQRIVSDSLERDIAIPIGSEAQTIAPVSVQAGRYAAADEPGAVLTPLEIVTIPGTAADVNRAIQTLPGVQQVDEGTGLFVRGGDYTETRVYLNGGRLLNPAQLQNSSGTFVGTLDPFLLDAVYFTSGGFGARYGDALSAIVDLHTQRRPEIPTATFSAGLAAIGVNAATPGPNGTGIRVVADENNLSPVVWLNGSPRQFSIAPRGGDRTVSAFWDYRPSAKLSLFATDQTTRVGTLTETPSVVDTFSTSARDRAVVVAWSDVFGRFAPQVTLSSSTNDRTDDYGSFRLASPSRLSLANALVGIALTDGVTFTSGVEGGALHSEISGSIPATSSDQRADARVRLYQHAGTSRSLSGFQELDARLGERTRVTSGYRLDHWNTNGQTTVDPRVNAAYKITNSLTATAAWGVYRQSVDPTLQVLRADTTDALPSMRATHLIGGLQLGEGTSLIRVEGYLKKYSNLAAPDRDYLTIGNGGGDARGVDVMARGTIPGGISTRVVYSYVHSVRTDPSTGIISPAPADVTHGLTLIGTRPIAGLVTLGATFRYATGRPFTPVVGATRASRDSVWTPLYGAPGSDRLPAYARLDLSASLFRVVRPGFQVVGYTALTNVLDRANTYTRRYSPDYSTFHNVTSVFNRSIYFGGVLTLTKS